MTELAWVLLALTGAFGLTDWVAVARRRRALEYVAKPATTAALVATALALDPRHSDVRAAFVVALVFSLIGDVCLMLPSDRFVAGLAAFLLAHVAYLVGFAVGAGTAGELVIGVAIVAAVAVPLGVRLVRAVRRRAPALVAAVGAYVVVIGAMVAAATAWGNVWAVAGAWLFFASDALIGETRFVRPSPARPEWARLAIMVTYHLGQASLVVSLAH